MTSGIQCQTYHKTLSEYYDSDLKVVQGGTQHFARGFVVKKANDEWPKDANGQKVTSFSAEVLLQKERRLQFD
jgi:UDP-N-acetylmuramoylalanine-D-glutamate ligase